MLMVAACGGGGGSSAPAPAPVVPTADRIEPFDPSPASAPKSAAVPPAPGRAVPTTRVRLGPLPATALQQNVAPVPGNGKRQQIGVARDLDATATAAGLRAQLQWHATERGTQRAAISFEAQGAQGLRLGVLVRALPVGAVLRFYAQTNVAVLEVSGQEVLDILARNLQAGDTGDAARTYWSPDFGGAETTLELELPVNADLSRLDISLPMLSHFFVSPEHATPRGLTKVGEAASCNVDVSCRPDFSSESRSVARMLFVENGSTFLCTGTLLNDAQSSTTPYFLSARHCISTQSVASSLTTDWFYRSAACNSSQIIAGTQRLNRGATLLYEEPATDTSFMRLNAAPPPGVVFAGSYFGAVALDADTASIHYPRGDLQKLSIGSVKQFDNCTFESCLVSTPQVGRFLSVGLSTGVNEAGSSGSGLFVPIGSRRYVTGQLLGGASSCLNPAGFDHYGRFDLAFKAGIKNWLKPDFVAPSSPTP